MNPGNIIGWLASRQPPLKRARVEEAGISNLNPLRIDVTDRLCASLEARDRNPGQVLEVLWDCRLLLRMDVDRVPDGIARGVLVTASAGWARSGRRAPAYEVVLAQGAARPTVDGAECGGCRALDFVEPRVGEGWAGETGFRRALPRECGRCGPSRRG